VNARHCAIRAGTEDGRTGCHPPVDVMETGGSTGDPRGVILLAGGLSNGEDLLAAQAMGADLCYLGTRFINTTESRAEAAYQNMIIEAVSGDIIHTPAVSGIPANFMRQSLEAAGYPMDKLNQAGELNYGDKLKPVDDEAKAWKTVWSAGQGVSQITDVVSVSDLVGRIGDEYRRARARLCE